MFMIGSDREICHLNKDINGIDLNFVLTNSFLVILSLEYGCTKIYRCMFLIYKIQERH